MLGAMPARAAADRTRTGLTLVVGEEDLLVERAVSGAVAAARGGPEISADPARAAGPASHVDAPAGVAGAGYVSPVHDVAAGELALGDLAELTAPSLFGGECVVVVRGAQDASKEVAGELTGLAADLPSDVTLVITHVGGVKGKALLVALTKQDARVVECPKITRLADRVAFVRGEFRRFGRTVDESGVRALLDAVGTDLRAVAAACSQLAADTEGTVTEAVVVRYYRGRADTTGFAVADRAVEGKLADALELLRWALAVGVAPVLITSALAQSVRLIGRVASAPRGSSDAELASEIGAPPWKIDVARRQARGWTPDGIARALAVVAEADAAVKGESTSPGYALEQAIRVIVACRAR